MLLTKLRTNRVPTLAAALALICASAAAQTLPAGVRQNTTFAGITEYGFPNGLRVLLLPDSSSPKITVNVVYLVGSRHEGYGETGMAHLLEHMNFILTTNGRNVKKELVDRGAQWNGTTDYDRTNYYETFAASDENLRWALGLEADRMVNIRMEKQLLDTEMTVVRNEFERGENSATRVLEERVLSTAYLWHNYGKSVIGSRADLEHVPIDRLAAFYRKYYQPDNAVLVVAGRIDTAKTLSMVADSMGKLPRPARKLDEMYTAEPAQDGERTVELRRVGTGKDLIVAYHATAMAHPDTAALEVLDGILNGAGGTGRLTKALVDNKLAVSARISIREMHDPGFIVAAASLSDDQNLDAAKRALLDTIASVAKEPPTKDEVDRAKNRITRQMEQSLSNSQQMAMGLTSNIAQGDWRLFFLNYDQVAKVTPADVVRVAKLYFKDSNRTVGVFIPTADPDRTVVPDTPDLAGALKDLKTTIKVSDGEEFEPTPANFEKHITRQKLSNGARVALMPKKVRGETAYATVELRMGDEKSLVGKAAVAQITGAMLMRGTKTKTRQQIQDELDKLDARVSVSGGGGFGAGGGRGGGGRGGPGGGSLSTATASVSAKSDKLIPGLRLAMEMLREPAFPEADFEQVRQQQITAIERGKTEPAQLAAEALQKALSPYPKGDVRYYRTIDERIADLKKVTLDDVKAFHAGNYGASSAVVAVVGQFDPSEVRKALDELVAGWKSPGSYTRITSSYSKVQTINLKIETPDKQNAQFNAGLPVKMSDADPDYPAMVLANYIFGGSITSHMADRIRNREGLSYSVSSSFAAPTAGDAATFTAFAIFNPVNGPKAEASFRDELAKTLANGFTSDEVEKAKKAVRDCRALRWLSVRVILNQSGSYNSDDVAGVLGDHAGGERQHDGAIKRDEPGEGIGAEQVVGAGDEARVASEAVDVGGVGNDWSSNGHGWLYAPVG